MMMMMMTMVYKQTQHNQKCRKESAKWQTINNTDPSFDTKIIIWTKKQNYNVHQSNTKIKHNVIIIPTVSELTADSQTHMQQPVKIHTLYDSSTSNIKINYMLHISVSCCTHNICIVIHSKLFEQPSLVSIRTQTKRSVRKVNKFPFRTFQNERKKKRTNTYICKYVGLAHAKLYCMFRNCDINTTNGKDKIVCEMTTFASVSVKCEYSTFYGRCTECGFGFSLLFR